MANMMATVNELNDAMEIIKAECSAHEGCEDCYFAKRNRCKLFESIPMDWETIKDGEQDGKDTIGNCD